MFETYLTVVNRLNAATLPLTLLVSSRFHADFMSKSVVKLKVNLNKKNANLFKLFNIIRDVLVSSAPSTKNFFIFFGKRCIDYFSPRVCLKLLEMHQMPTCNKECITVIECSLKIIQKLSNATGRQ